MGDTPLHIAIEKQYDDIARILIKTKMDLNTMIYDVTREPSKKREITISHTDGEMRETYGHLVETHKQYAYGKLLSDEGANLETEKREVGITVLHFSGVS